MLSLVNNNGNNYINEEREEGQEIHVRTLPLPDELILKIFSYLGEESLFVCALSCKAWKNFAYDKSFYPKKLVGEKEWKNLVGMPEEEPHLPLQIRKDFKPDIHFLTFIPETIDGRPLTIERFEYLELKPEWKFSFEQNENINEPIETGKGHWFLLEKKTIYAKIAKRHFDSEKVADGHKVKIPNLRETLVSLFMDTVTNLENSYKEGRWASPVGPQAEMTLSECWNETRDVLYVTLTLKEELRRPIEEINSVW